MKLYCPHCGVKGVADDSYRGKNIKCPKCQKIFIAAEPAVAIASEALIPSESREELRDEETLTEPEVPAEEEAPVEALPAEEIVESEAVEEIIEVEAAREAVEAESVEEMVEEEELLTPPVNDARPEEEETAVLDWDEIAAEIEARTAEDERREAGEKEELPAGLFAETAEEEPALPEAEEMAGPEIPEPLAAENAGTDDRLPDREELSGAVAESEVWQEEQLADAPTAEEGREDHFIFEDRPTGTEPVQEVEDQPYGMIKEQCWQCGKKNRSGVPFAASGGRLYCPACAPAAEPLSAFAGQSAGGPPPLQDTEDAEPPAFTTEGQPPRFTIGGALREAWQKTKGAKGPILAGSAVMYLTILFLAAGGGFLLPMFGYDLTAPAPGMAGQIGNFLFQALIDAISVLFTAGLLFMGIRKVAGDPISWKMIFTGFSDSGKILVATFLQSVLIIIGLLILVLPGIYLAIGYSMTIPLIVDRKMSPWQAMEASRKAIHLVWWRVMGLYLVMGVIFVISMVPLGIGSIWTWPMFIILAGVVYRSLFDVEK